MILVSGHRQGSEHRGTLFAVYDGKLVEHASLPGSDFYGVLRHANRWYVAIRGALPKLAMFDERMQFLRAAPLPSTCDPHGLYLDGADICLMSSAEDRIYRFAPDLSPLGVEQFGSGGNDRYHVNDVTVIDGQLVATMFRDTTRGDWNQDVEQGCVKSAGVVSPESMGLLQHGLIKPHSPVFDRDELFVCDSGSGRVVRDGRTIYAENDRWTRGLLVDGDRVYVGSVTMDASLAEVIELKRDGDIVRRTSVPVTAIYSLTKVEG